MVLNIEHKMLFTKHIRLYGRVQGVYFRESMRAEATKLGLTGWVRNRQDGTVEAVIQGGDAAQRILLAWAETGPTLAHVERVEIQKEETAAEGNFIEFSIWPTE